jgi:hypothetical protein
MAKTPNKQETLHISLRVSISMIMREIGFLIYSLGCT